MWCADFESDLLEDQAGGLSAARCASLEAHLRGCPGCQALAARLRALDQSLSQAFTAPALPADFGVRLAERIRVEGMPAGWSLEQKRRLQAEFEAGAARLHRARYEPPPWFDRLGYGLLLALVGLMVARCTPGWLEEIELPAVIGPDGQGIWPLGVLLAAGVAVAAGLSIAFPREFKRIRALME